MEMQGSRPLAATQKQAWDALNDPAVLKVCVPGCEKLEATGENQYEVVTALRIGPVSARFNGRIQLSEVQPPESYVLTFDGQGGAAGFGKGSARVRLGPAALGDGCELSYSVQAQVGGKIAQVGQRLIDGVARSMADDFFKRFDEELQRRYPVAAAEAAADATAAPATAEATGKTIPWWTIAAIVIVLLGLWWASR